MNPKFTFATINGVVFISNGLKTDAAWKRYYHRGNISYLCWSFGKQLASYLQITDFESCYCYRMCFLCRSKTSKTFDMAEYDLKKK